MRIRISRLGFVVALGGVVLQAGADDTATYSGLELTAKSVSRSKRVSLQDCPPGENIVRGVIRPVEDNEFATIQIGVKVLPAFEGRDVPKPLLFDDAGNEYKTAQSFRDAGSQETCTCNFSFRVPTGYGSDPHRDRRRFARYQLPRKVTSR